MHFITKYLFQIILFLTSIKFSYGQIKSYNSKNLNPQNINRVIVVCSEHFDAGFSNTTTEVFNKYFNTYFPEVAKRTDPDYSSSELDFKFMFQPYPLSLFLNCPPNIPELKCPNSSTLELVEKAIVRGNIWLNGFPDNSELALLSPTLIKFAIESIVG